jgi:hypothetical protein
VQAADSPPIYQFMPFQPYSSASRPTKYLWSERKYRKEGLPEHPYAPIPRNAFKAPGILHSRSSTPTSEEEPAAVSSGCEPPRIDRKNERRATPTDSLRVGLAEDASPRSRHAGSSSSRKRRTPDNDQQDSASSSQSGSHKRRARSSYISSDEEVELVLGLFDHARSPSPPRRGRSSPTPGSRRLKCIEDSGVHVPEDAAEFLLAPPPKPELFSEELLEESPWWERPGSVSEGVSLPECPESVVAERGSPPPTRPLCQALPFPQYSIFMTDVGAVGGVAYVSCTTACDLG